MPDPDPTLALLWRHAAPEHLRPVPARRGPRQKLTVDDVVDAAIEVADEHGLAAVSMRSLAQRLGLGTMSIYGYVPGRAELVALMVDQVLGRTAVPELPEDLRERLEVVARVQHAEWRAHPWLLDVTGLRAWLGPHSAARYEWQLSAVEGIGLDDVEMDQTVALLVGFVAGVVRSEHRIRQEEAEAGMTEREWWEANAGTLGELMAECSHPLAGRVGTAAGEAYQAASDPARELEFGLARIIDGILVHVAARA